MDVYLCARAPSIAPNNALTGAPSSTSPRILQALRKFKDCIEIVDVGHKLPELKRVPGVSKWSLLNRKGNPVNCFAEAPDDSTKFVESVFQPTEEEAEWMHLERCLRLLPHYQDTGGFFVTLFRKTAPSSGKQARIAASLEKAAVVASEGGSAEGESTKAEEEAGEAGEAGEDARADDGPMDGTDLPEQRARGAKGRVFKEDPFM